VSATHGRARARLRSVPRDREVQMTSSEQGEVMQVPRVEGGTTRACVAALEAPQPVQSHPGAIGGAALASSDQRREREGQRDVGRR
jgi:hypothetical protein